MRFTRGIIATMAASAICAVGLAVIPAAQADDETKCGRTNNSVRKLLECVTLKGVLEHERALQSIADANGGTRASGTPGYDASVDYVERRLKKAGYVVTRQSFDVFMYEEVGPSALEQTSPNAVTYVEGTDFAATPHSEPGDVTAAVTAVDVQLGLEQHVDQRMRSQLTSRASQPATSP